jgi:hypothetical protein
MTQESTCMPLNTSEQAPTGGLFGLRAHLPVLYRVEVPNKSYFTEREAGKNWDEVYPEFKVFHEV